jgi:hypothetical protein
MTPIITSSTFTQNHTLSYHETTFKISFMVCPFHIIFYLILKKNDITRLNPWKSFLYLYALLHVLTHLKNVSNNLN